VLFGVFISSSCLAYVSKKMRKLFSKKETPSDTQQSFIGKVYTVAGHQYVVEEIIAEGTSLPYSVVVCNLQDSFLV